MPLGACSGVLPAPAFPWWGLRQAERKTHAPKRPPAGIHGVPGGSKRVCRARGAAGAPWPQHRSSQQPLPRCQKWAKLPCFTFCPLGISVQLRPSTLFPQGKHSVKLPSDCLPQIQETESLNLAHWDTNSDQQEQETGR